MEEDARTSSAPNVLLDHEQEALERLLLDVRRDLERRLNGMLAPETSMRARDVLEDVFDAAVVRAVATLHEYLDGPPTQPAVGRLVA